MNGYLRMTEMKWFVFLCCIVFCIVARDVIAEPVDTSEPTKTEARLKLEEKAKEEKKKKKRRVAVKISREEIDKLNFPEDTTTVMTAKELRISGNTLITTEELLSNVPLVFNSSDVPLQEAESINLYDFRTLCDIIDNPGQPRQISARTIQGLTQCILSLYRDKGYSGIYVSVPPEALVNGRELRDEILLINITEATFASVTTSYFTPEREKVEKGYLKESFLRRWSPVKVGEVGKQKELEDFVNLLNLNPDRYISSVISKGPNPKTLALNYNIYEANPWHFFVQVDNAGTNDRQWAPRTGLINTNLLGFDDRLTVFHQARWDSGIDDEYSIYGSYDFPILGPKLRLDLFAGYSEFDVQGGGGINFIGKGKVYGGRLRYNVFQKDGWFYDLTTSLSREESEVSTDIFSAILGSKVKMDLWGIGANIHRRSDMKNTSVAYNYIRRVGGSGQEKYWDSGSLTGARTNAEKDFAIHAITAYHSQYLKADKVQRLTGSLRWIIPEERLVPAKMTTFGGMYSVRGYKEDRIVADGGVLASAQYEYDLVKAGQTKDVSQEGVETKPWLRKLAPLAFFDYGRTYIKDPVPGEDGDEDLYSIGFGTIVEIGDNFSGAVYFGFPLESTDTTDSGDGRLNVSLMVRW